MERFSSKTNARLFLVSSREGKLIKVASTLLALSNATFLIFYQIEQEKKFDEAYSVIPIDHRDFTWLYMYIRIAIALSVGAFGTWPWNIIGLLVSGLAYVWVLLEYALWHIWYLRQKTGSDIEAFSKPDVAGFYGASWWDVFVLILTIALLIWITKILITSLKSSIQNIRRPTYSK